MLVIPPVVGNMPPHVASCSDSHLIQTHVLFVVGAEGVRDSPELGFELRTLHWARLDDKL